MNVISKKQVKKTKDKKEKGKKRMEGHYAHDEKQQWNDKKRDYSI